MSDGIGDISYNSPAGAPPPFVNIGGARNGTSLDASNFVTLGQSPGAAGDPGRLTGVREIPMRQFFIILSDHLFDPIGQMVVAARGIEIQGDDTLPGVLGLNIIALTSGTSSELINANLTMIGNGSQGIPATINLEDSEDILNFPWIIVENPVTHGWTLTWGNDGSTFGTVEYLNGGTLQIRTSGLAATTDPSALLHLVSTSAGFLLPKMTTVQKNNIVSPATGLQVFDITVGNNSRFNGTAWINAKDILSGSFSQVVVAATVFTVTFGVTLPSANYQVSITPTSALSAALFFVTNKTTTTFQVTYLAGLTGTVTFDWEVIN